MSTYVSAFDEAPKTPTRSGTVSKRKVLHESPENTPPGSPTTSFEKRGVTAVSRLPGSKALNKSLKDVAVAFKSQDTSRSVSTEGLKSSGMINSLTDTRSVLGEPFDMEDGASQMSNSRFEQMEHEVASLRDEIKSLQSVKGLDISEVDSEPKPLLLEDEKTNTKYEQLEQTIVLLQSRIDQLEVAQEKAATEVELLNTVTRHESPEVDLMKSISARRMETLVSSVLPFLSESKTLQIARWMNESMDFSARNTMRRIWSLILLVDLAAIFVQARFPHVWKQLDFKQVPRGWYKRLSAMRYCLEMVLIVQFGIAAQQVLTHKSTISAVKATASAVYEALRTLFVKYLPTGLVIACTASFATWLYRNRLTQQMLS